MKILLDSVYIHNGGGKVLLDMICEKISEKISEKPQKNLRKNLKKNLREISEISHNKS